MPLQELLTRLSEQGALGLVLAVALVVIYKLYMKNQSLWQCILDLQEARLDDAKQQFEFVSSFRQCMERVIDKIRDSRREEPTDGS